MAGQAPRRLTLAAVAGDRGAKGGDEAVRLAQLLRQVEVWGVIMIGSALGLAAAAIQLALSYH